jgi:hypothetical protein
VRAHIDFCGELYPLADDGQLTIGRVGDVVIDDNPFLHRQFLKLFVHDGLLWLRNIGSQLTASMADEAGLTQTRLSPGAQVPVASPRTAVWFTAGSTTYEFEIVVDEGPTPVTWEDSTADGTGQTMGVADLTPDQKLLLVALAEDMLRRGGRGQGSIPSSAVAAERLGWTLTKFNRKLDSICEKLALSGVRGLAGQPGKLASSRRTRLVDHALSTGLVTLADLALLDRVQPPSQ